MKASGKMAYLPGSRNPDVVTMLCIWLPLAMAQDSGRGILFSIDWEKGYLSTRAARSVRFLDSFPLEKEERSKAICFTPFKVHSLQIKHPTPSFLVRSACYFYLCPGFIPSLKINRYSYSTQYLSYHKMLHL